MIAKKALMLASVASMIDQFNIPNIQLLQSLGYKVDVVADFSNNPGTITKERAELLQRKLRNMDVKVFDIPIPRTINPSAILTAYKQISSLLEANHYNLIHCHSPIGGALCRLAAKNERIRGTKVIYTAHGFHFYEGAPLKNWMLFYPVEKFLSKWTDVLITINKEDYKRAVENFNARKTVYIPGIGIDIDRFRQCDSDTIGKRQDTRKKIGIPAAAKLLISVGELSVRKNHQIIIRALNAVNDSNIYYIVVGEGALNNELKSIDKTGRLKLLGYRNDIADLLHCSDLFVFPSLQEGLPVALMEAMASGIPCLASRIRGNTDLLENIPKSLVKFNTVDEWKKTITDALKSDSVYYSNCMVSEINKYRIENVNSIMSGIYSQFITN